MASFEKSLAVLFGDEGGYSPKDNNSGPVNRGVTQATLDAHWAKFPAQCTRLGLPRKVEDLTKPQTAAFYQMFFWLPWFAQVQSQQVADLLFSLAVNQGPAWPIKHLKMALTQLGIEPKSSQLAARVNSIDINPLVASIYTPALERYRELAQKNPKVYGACLKSWELRLRKLCGIS